MRIIAGDYKNLLIDTTLPYNIYNKPKKSDNHYTLKPSKNMVKQAIFSMIFTKYCHQDYSEMSFLDLCCGSGAMGLEALSRNFGYAAFIDISPVHLQITQNNIRKLIKLGMEASRAQTFYGDVQKQGLEKLFPKTSRDMLIADHMKPNMPNKINITQNQQKIQNQSNNVLQNQSNVLQNQSNVLPSMHISIVQESNSAPDGEPIQSPHGMKSAQMSNMPRMPRMSNMPIKSSFDIIFCDPPYFQDQEYFQALFQQIDSTDLLKSGGVLILETAKRSFMCEKIEQMLAQEPYGHAWSLLDSRNYGVTNISLWSKFEDNS